MDATASITVGSKVRRKREKRKKCYGIVERIYTRSTKQKKMHDYCGGYVTVSCEPYRVARVHWHNAVRWYATNEWHSDIKLDALELVTDPDRR